MLKGRVKMSNRIKELRLEKGLSQRKLAEETGISQQSLSFYEKGDRNPKIETWQKLADYFNVSIGYVQGTTRIRNEQLEATDSIANMGLVKFFKSRYGSDYLSALNEFISDPKALEVLGNEQDLLLFNLLLKIFTKNSDTQKRLSDLPNSQKRDVSQQVQDLFKLLTDDTSDKRILRIKRDVTDLLDVYGRGNYKLATDTSNDDDDTKD